MDQECPHCGALLFKNELGDKERIWQMCCKNGSITEDLIPPMNFPPLSIYYLLTGQDEHCKFFKKHIYIINSALRLGMSVMNQKHVRGRGIRKFILSGRVHHVTPDFNELQQKDNFNECRMYTYEPEEQLNSRLRLPFLKRITDDKETKWIIGQLQDELMKT